MGSLEPVGDTTGDAFVVSARFVGANDRRFARTNPLYTADRDVNFETTVNGNRNFFSTLNRRAIACCVDALARHLLTREKDCAVQVDSETLRKRSLAWAARRPSPAGW